MADEGANPPKYLSADSDVSNTANPIQEDVIKGIEDLNITQQHQMATQTPPSFYASSSSSFSPSTMLAQESQGKSIPEQPIQEDDGGDDDLVKGIGGLNITQTPSSSSSSSSPPIVLALGSKRKYVAEPFIQENLNIAQKQEMAEQSIQEVEDLRKIQQEEMEGPASPSSASSFTFPLLPPMMDHKNRKSEAEKPFQDDGIVTTDDEDWHPFMAFKKRKCLPNLVIQEYYRIGKEFRIKPTKKTQLLISSSSYHGDAPASAGGQVSDNQVEENQYQVEEDQDQESPRNTANLRGKSRLAKMGPSKPPSAD